MQQVLKDDVSLKENISGVYCRRSVPSDVDELPVIIIYPLNEPVDPFDQSPKSYKRYYEYVIEIQTVHDDDEKLCDEMDDLSYMVANAIENDPVLRGWESFHNDGYMMEETFSTSVQYDQQGEGGNPTGAVRMTFQTVYIEDPANKKALNDFNMAEFKWKIGNHGENQAIDEIEFES